MKKLLIQLTEDLVKCLESMGEPIGPLIERLLRNTSAVKEAKKKLKIELPDRPTTGRPKKQKDGE